MRMNNKNSLSFRNVQVEKNSIRNQPQNTLTKILIHSSFLSRLSINALLVRKYSFFSANTNSSPNNSFFTISEKLSPLWFSSYKFIFSHISSIRKLIALIGSSYLSPISILAANFVSYCFSALCHTNMSQNFVNEVKEKCPYSDSVLIRICISSLSPSFMIQPKYSSSCNGLKKYFYFCVGEFITNSLGLPFVISFLYLFSKKVIFDSLVLGMLQIDRVFLFGLSNYDDKKSPKYFIFLFKLIVLRIFVIFYFSWRFYYFFLASMINCYCENFLLRTYFYIGEIHCFCRHLTGYETTILLLDKFFGDEGLNMLSTRRRIMCLRIASFTLKSRKLLYAT